MFILPLHFLTAERVPADATDMPQTATAVPLPANAWCQGMRWTCHRLSLQYLYLPMPGARGSHGHATDCHCGATTCQYQVPGDAIYLSQVATAVPLHADATERISLSDVVYTVQSGRVNKRNGVVLLHRDWLAPYPSPNLMVRGLGLAQNLYLTSRNHQGSNQAVLTTGSTSQTPEECFHRTLVSGDS